MTTPTLCVPRMAMMNLLLNCRHGEENCVRDMNGEASDCENTYIVCDVHADDSGQ